MDFKSKKDIVFLILAGFFITNAIVAEIIGGKLVNFFGLFTQSIGIILWPVVFLLTDLMNEHFGKEGVRKLTFITVGLIIYIYLLLYVAMKIPAVPFSPVNDNPLRLTKDSIYFITDRRCIYFLVNSQSHRKISYMAKIHRKYSHQSIN